MINNKFYNIYNCIKSYLFFPYFLCIIFNRKKEKNRKLKKFWILLRISIEFINQFHKLRNRNFT